MDDFSPASLLSITSVKVVSLKNVDANRVDEYMLDAGATGVTIDGADAQRVADLWRSLPPGEQFRCHNPPYGLRYRSRDRILCEASICRECDNIFGDAEGVHIHDEFDGVTRRRWTFSPSYVGYSAIRIPSNSSIRRNRSAAFSIHRRVSSRGETNASDVVVVLSEINRSTRKGRNMM